MHSRFFLTDLQVHSPADPEHGYGQYQGREDDVARAIVEAHLDAGVEVIAVTDHIDLDWYPRIAAAADDIAHENPERRLWVFPGFEVSASGCHLILIWDRGEQGYKTADRHLAGLYPANVPRREGGTFRPLDEVPIRVARTAVEAGALVIAPHSTKKGMGAFASKVVANVGDLVSSGYVSAWDIHGDKQNGVLVGPQQYFGDHTPAWICTGDTRTCADAGQRAVWLKIDQPPTLDGLRHAFLAPATRIRFPRRLHETYDNPRGVKYADTVEPSCSRIARVKIAGGFHDGMDVRFAPGLNAIIGGRGTGKSAIIEIIRYGLGLPDPKVDRLIENRHRNLPSDAEVTIEIVASDGTEYSIHRPGGGIQGPTVTRSDSTITQIEPTDRFRPAIYGQTQLRHLIEVENLRDFCAQQKPDEWKAIQRREREHTRHFQKLSDEMRQLEDHTSQKDEKEAELHDLEDRLCNAHKAGAEDRVDELKGIARLSQQVDVAAEWPQTVADALGHLRNVLPPPEVPDHNELPNQLHATLDALEVSVRSAIETVEQATSDATSSAAEAVTAWSEWQTTRTSAISAELAALGIDKPEQLAVDQGRVARLANDVGRLEDAQEALERLQVECDKALEDLLAVRRERARLLRSIADELNEQLGGTVHLVVNPISILQPFQDALRSHISGVHNSTITRTTAAAKHPRKLVEPLRQARMSATEHPNDAVAGRQTLTEFGMSKVAIDQLLQIDECAIRQIEATDVPDDARLEMNLGTAENPLWQNVEHMSPGQSATALLALALIGGSEPLIVDQPEEDLDNRFVFKEVVGKVSATCDRRQVIVVTHDANIPIVGDAELVLALDAEASRGTVLACGGLEHPTVAQHARDILEGGEDAFYERMRRYPR